MLPDLIKQQIRTWVWQGFTVSEIMFKFQQSGITLDRSAVTQYVHRL